ncbi:unnamed protein product [Ranitomeya imitator]|uniref:Large ribosomal subunit protein uL2 C-terminal domain-containing protein n=1 Tax=Ranitomeya imitator TaxID=111125 RepID=A0ABN9M568_9NEOB|nr:unnamed protein product [Ranitomeya imitator]
MRNIPVGSTVHNVEMKPGKGGQLARSSGYFTFKIVARDGAYVTCVCVLVKWTEHVKSKLTAVQLWAKSAMLSICWRRACTLAWCSSYRSRYCDEPQSTTHMVVVKVVTLVSTPVTPWGVQTKGKKTPQQQAY